MGGALTGPGQDEAAAVVTGLTAIGATVAVAESCTGGGLLACLTSVPGASACVWGGTVVYADEAKSILLGVAPEVVREYGAVSAAVTRELASRVRAVAGTTFGVAVTGWAGPAHGDEPVGTVYIAVAQEGACSCERAVYDGDRARVRAQAVTAAIAALLAVLEETPTW